MTIREATPSELEGDAERARARIGETLGQLRRQLTPTHLIDEWARNSGLKDITADKVFDYAAKRHPARTAFAGLGIGLLVYAALQRKREREHESEGEQGMGSGSHSSVKTMLAELTATAAAAFRERAETRRDEIMDAAKTHVAFAAQELGDTLEQGLDDVLARGAVPEEARPVLATTLQLLLAAAAESVLPRRGSKPPPR